MRLKILCAFICASLSSPAWAGFRIAAGLGLGQTEASNEITETEGPFVTLISMDYLLDSKNMVGLEHIRSLSLSPMSTSMSFTGIYYSYYLNAIPTPYVSADKLGPEEIVYRDFGFFVGVGFGIAGSNNLPDENGKTSNAAGFYLSPRVGADLQLTRTMGARGQLLIATTMMGTGTISATSLLGSLFWSF
jgi:hypothetical protein